MKIDEKALIMAYDVVINKNLPVLYCNSYLSDNQIVKKIIIMATGFDEIKLKSGSFNNEEYRLVHDAMRDLYNAPFHILDGLPGIEQTVKTINDLSKEKNIKKMFIDYNEKDKEVVKEIINVSIIPIIGILN